MSLLNHIYDPEDRDFNPCEWAYQGYARSIDIVEAIGIGIIVIDDDDCDDDWEDDLDWL